MLYKVLVVLWMYHLMSKRGVVVVVVIALLALLDAACLGLACFNTLAGWAWCGLPLSCLLGVAASKNRGSLAWTSLAQRWNYD